MSGRARVPPALDLAAVLAARRARGLAAIFDLDGVLAAIAPTPDAVGVPPATRRALRRLARRADTVVGVVSGRPLRQVERLVGAAGLWLAGLHGAVRRPPGGGMETLWSPETGRVGARLARTLAARVAGMRGVWVEAKGPVVAVHTRAASPAGRARARRAAASARPPGWRLLEGRRVLELRPAGLPTKGDAVRWILAQRPAAAALYAGDDATDEDAFRALGRGDFPVLVNPGASRRERGGAAGATRARFTLADPAAVGALVEGLARP